MTDPERPSPEESGSGGADDELALDAALLPRLELIEDQPLADRSDAYLQVHDELRDALESGDSGSGDRGR